MKKDKCPSRGRCYKRPGSAYYQAEFYFAGKLRRFSTGKTNKKEAEAMLDEERRKALESAHLPHDASKTTLADLIRAYLRDYEVKGHTSTERARLNAFHLARHFGDGLDGKTFGQITDEDLIAAGHAVLASDIGTPEIERYQDARRAKGKAGATINREVRALARMFHLGIKRQLIASAPMFPDAEKEAGPRQGFLRYADVEAIAGELPAHLADVARFAFWSGWRKSKILGLTWAEVDLAKRRIELDSDKQSAIKRTPALVLPEGHPLINILERRLLERVAFVDLVFHSEGEPIKGFTNTWRRACKRAGFVGQRFHDLRRSTVKAMVDSGVLSETTMMQLTGHRTRAIFSRYSITTDADVLRATQAMADHVRGETPKTPKVRKLRK